MTVYEIITDKIIKSLEGGVIPWHKPWTAMMPTNFVTKKAYRGINPFLLAFEGRKSPYWVSFKQMVALGGRLKEDDKKSSIVVFWTWLESKKENEKGEKDLIPMLRYYNVFNLDQIEGIEVPAEDQLEFKPIEAAEKVVEGYENRPPVTHGGDRAYYSPLLDKIQMPAKETFTSEENYYATLFHEMVHSTGHKSRLAREGVTDVKAFGSESYSKEELIAEIGASFLMGETGIVNSRTEENTTAYIQNWLQQLRGDKKMVVHAAANAQKAADWILGRKFGDNG